MKVGSANNFYMHAVIRIYAFSSILYMYKSQCLFFLYPIFFIAIICICVYTDSHFLTSYFKYLLKFVKGAILLLVRVLTVYAFCVINLFKKCIYKQFRM
jgi:hypothetical protein